MDWPPNSISRRERAAALIIVLVFVVLLTGLVLAYFTRATSDRPVAHSSFNQSKADELAQSAMDLVIGALRQEITGPLPTPTPPYFPLPNANMLPMRSGNPPIVGGVDPIPNLIRRSVRSDALSSPALPSLASFVNSTTDASANSRSVSLARWNKHYLLPRYNTGTPSDYTPSSPLVSPFNPNPAVANGFTPPDWVILTRGGPVAFPAWDPTLKDQTQSNNSYAVGRYAYAIYDEGGLLDANVAGYPEGNNTTTAAQYGPKGVSAFADLAVLGLSTADINAIVGWRNYFSAQNPNGNLGTFPFNFNSTTASNYVTSVLSNTNGFMSVPIPSPIPKNMSRTDQAFTTRQSLIQLLVASGLSANAASALQYLGTFSRELNAPSWAPTQDASDLGGNNGAGNIYAYKTNADSGTAINRNLLNVRVPVGTSFIRADGTTAAGGDPLINRRFPLTRLAGLGPSGIVTTANSTIVNGVPSVATAATIQRDFGLVWNGAPNYRWDYAGPSGTSPRTSIETLDQVANENPGREPNFFELLKAVILSGSVGLGSGADVAHTRTFVAAEQKYYDTADTTHGTSSDYQIMQIGANIITQWDSGNLPIFMGFGQDPSSVGNPYEIAGIKNLPYLNKIVFKPYWHKSGSTNIFDAWILPSLWNPHQNAPTPASQNVRVQMTLGTGTNVTVTATSPAATSQITATSFMTFSAPNFGPTPSGATSVIGSSGNVTQSPDNYYGFHFPQITLASAPSSSSTAYPNFGTSCTFEVQVDVTGNGNWKSYQKWSGCAQPATALVYSNPLSNPQNDKTLQDPEFVALDPRTVRFGVWGNDGKTSGTPQDYSNGTQYTLDSTLNSPSLPVEVITALPPQGSTWFTLGTSPYSLYQYANNGNSGATAPHYTDLDLVQRLGDFPTAGDATDPANDELQPTLSTIRPLALNGAFQNGVFQSVAELGHVFRGQPWKTLNFTSAMPTTSITKARSADAGLLDIFTLHESSMEAGKTSLNTRQTLALTAILSGATRTLAGTSPINATERDNIVTALTNLTAAQPMLNKAELVTRLAADSHVTGLGNKEARELVMRAFSDACQTRTWNLMIDVIAQSGRYPPNASTLAGFIVEGEQRYWVHVAIDRFTGQVIDKQIEVVNE
jgi:hypothetical protein